MSTITSKSINILPDRSLMPKIGQSGYSVSQAISELVDNSIDARQEGRTLDVEIDLDQKKGLVKIIDNGIGMDEETAGNSIRLAHSNKVNKLGEFGLGLKTAASSLGKNFEIITTQEGSDEEFHLEYDEEEWLKRGDWTKHEMKIKKGVSKSKSGTTIVVKNLRFKIYPNLPINVRKDLSIRFAPFIENGEVMVKVNSKWCEAEPLELKVDYHEPDGKEPFRLKLESGNEVWGWRGLLKKGSDKGEYGFRVFRRGRLILQHSKLGFNPHPESRQIIGEIHLDHVPVTHNKREFIEESPLYQEINKEGGIFWNFMRDLVREARSSIRKTQIDQSVLDKMEIQKENIMKAIKRIPELKEYAFPDLKEKISNRLVSDQGDSNIEIEKRDSRDIVTIEEEPIPHDIRTRKPKKVQTKKTYSITIAGNKFKVDHSFVDLKTDSVMKDKQVDLLNGIQVYTNIAFPAFSNTKDHVFYGAWHIAEAIGEVMVDQNKKSSEDIEKIRDLILMHSAQLTRELDDIEKEKKDADRLKKEWEEKIKKISSLQSKNE